MPPRSRGAMNDFITQMIGGGELVEPIAKHQFRPWKHVDDGDLVVGDGDWECVFELFNKDTARVELLVDLFEDWDAPIIDSDGYHQVLCGNHWGPENCEQAESCSRLTLDHVRERIFAIIDATPNLDWLLRTNNLDAVRRMWPDGKRRANVWLGASVSCQEDADRNIPELLKVRDLAAKLFVSVEPLVGPVDLQSAITAACPNLPDRCERGRDGRRVIRDSEEGGLFVECACSRLGGIDWAIVAGESGSNARPCDVEWIRSIVGQCRDAGVPCFVKQFGANVVLPFSAAEATRWPGCTRLADFTTRALLHDPKGGDPSEWPESLRVREVPS